MKLKWQIYILSILMFALCAIAFGLMTYDMKLEQTKLAYENKISSLLISVGAFAKSDISFVDEKNIEELIERAELESLIVSKMQSKHRVVLETNPKITSENHTLSGIYTTGDFLVNASLLETDTIEIIESFWHTITYWLLAGLFFGLSSGYIIFKFLHTKIKILEEKLFEETKSKIEILEFKDLMFSARLLKNLNQLKNEKECNKLNSKNDNSSLSDTIISKLNPAKTLEISGFKISFDIANKNPLNSFYSILSDNSILYCKINTKLEKLEAFSNCVLLRDSAKKLLEKLPIQEAYAQLSKLFDIEIFNIIKFENNSIKHIILEENSIKEEALNLNNSILLSTQIEHKELALYTKLNFNNTQDKLNFIIKLLPKGVGGLYILIEA